MNEFELTTSISEAATNLEVRFVRVLAFLEYISAREGVDSKILLRSFGFPESLYKKLLKHFQDILMPPPGLIRMKNGREINIFTKELLKKITNIDQSQIEEVLEKYKTLRPIPNRDFDQFTATRITTKKRAVEMAKRGDLYERDIAFLGDDDLNSVAIALTKQPRKIVVFEIDQGIIDLIKKIASENNLNIEVVKQDVRLEMPNEYLGKFDTIFSDPPYTPNGISLFLNRGIELLKKKFSSRIYLCYGNSDRARERELEIQKIIFEKGLLINAKTFQFNKYHGAESIGSSSSLYLLDWTPKTSITKVSREKLYTNE